jgi:hypothetical protein
VKELVVTIDDRYIYIYMIVEQPNIDYTINGSHNK